MKELIKKLKAILIFIPFVAVAILNYLAMIVEEKTDNALNIMESKVDDLLN